jgi:5-(carboxyamino)imidazole ribonucleotide synthase
MLKDKALQKTWLQQHGLPTLPFTVISGKGCFPAFLADNYGGSLVQKARCGGYDGRGVQILKTVDAGQGLWDVPSIVEPFLPDCREIAVVTVRARNGDIQTFPPVSMEFDPHLNSVRTVSMPASISPALGAAAVALAERVVILLSGVGVFAVEMFVTPAGELLINEISPRVHNSGHVTLDACNVSQFEQHVRAVAGLPLVPITLESPAAMINILYSEPMRGHCPRTPRVDRELEPQTRVYWYGKRPGSMGRKMGHINVVAASAAEAVERAGRALDHFSGGPSERAA